MKSIIDKILIGCCFIIITSCTAHKKLQVAQSQVNELQDKNAKLNNTIDQLNGQITTLTGQNKNLSDDFAQYKKQCQDVAESYKVTTDILDEQEKLLKQIEERLEAALGDLENRGLDVYYKRGLVFVSMQDQVLYKSGSSTLDKTGVEALSKIAGVINDYPDVKVIVVGNTDDVLFKKGGSDNWSLSTERANGVVRTLRDVYNVDPARLTSAGRGRFNPVADNSTADGKAKNRRIDIIFNPDLDKLWDKIDH